MKVHTHHFFRYEFLFLLRKDIVRGLTIVTTGFKQNLVESRE